MKSQVFILLMGIALLKVSLVLAEGEEATTVAGAEASAVNSTVSDASASVPPSPQEADYFPPPWEIGVINCLHCGENDKNTLLTDTYRQFTDDIDGSATEGRCVRIYNKDVPGIEERYEKCVRTCINQQHCQPNCAKRARRNLIYSCEGLSWIAIVGIIIGVLILLAIAGVCIFCCLKKKRRGVVNGQPFQNGGQYAAVGPAAPPGYANQAPPPYQPSTAPSAYANQFPPPYANQPSAAYAYQPPVAPPAYANQAPAYANQPPAAPSAYANQPNI